MQDTKLTNRNILRHNTNTKKKKKIGVTGKCSQPKPQQSKLNQSILRAIFCSLVVKSDVRNAILACITILPVLLISGATTKRNIQQKQKCTQNGTNCYCYIKCCEVSKNFLTQSWVVCSICKGRIWSRSGCCRVKIP